MTDLAFVDGAGQRATDMLPTLSPLPGLPLRNTESLSLERSPAEVSQADIGHSVRRIVDASGHHGAANQPLTLHKKQVFENLSIFREMPQIIILER